MEAEARYTWVGAAVIALLAALVGGLLWLKGSGNEAGFQRYAIHFELRAEVLRLGSRVATTRMEFLGADGKLLSTGAGAYIVS